MGPEPAAVQKIWLSSIFYPVFALVGLKNLDYKQGMDVKTLETSSEIVDALGGNGPTGDITEADPKTVSAWRSANAFPPRTYLVMTAALAERGYAAPASLWKMIGASNEMESAS